MHREREWVASLHDPHRSVDGDEGAHLQDGTGRSHLPLRGKLGWMTPWFGLAKSESTGTRSLGTPDPKLGSPFFLKTAPESPRSLRTDGIVRSLLKEKTLLGGNVPYLSGKGCAA